MSVEVRASFSETLTFGASFSESDNANADFDAIVIASEVPDYDGEYTVIPKADREQVLQTNGKRMTDDVSVTRIPYYQASNVSGDTVYIGMEVSINGN